MYYMQWIYFSVVISFSNTRSFSAGITVAKRKPSLVSTPNGTSILTRFIVDHHLVAMVVDDTLTIRKLMEKMLLKLGFDRVDCYENGKKGLEALLAAPVDIVFSDVQMPIMTGPEVRFLTDCVLRNVCHA